MRRATLAALVALAIVATATADFAAAPGFSGRVADCTSCHRPPVEGDDAQVAITGIPDAWLPGTAYEWIVSVEGGPQTVPGGPQAGFEVEVLDGVLAPGADATNDVRRFYERQATYTEDGVFQREWSVRWTAPDLFEYPIPITVWVAGMAANGNHNTELNISDAGEHGDSVHTTQYIIPPAQETLDAWRAIPLAEPIVERIEPRGTGHTIHGRMADSNATAIEVYDGTTWMSRAAGNSWRVVVEGLDEVRLRAAGAERTSDIVVVDVGTGDVVEPAAGPDEESPVPALLPIIAFLIAWRRP